MTEGEGLETVYVCVKCFGTRHLPDNRACSGTPHKWEPFISLQEYEEEAKQWRDHSDELVKNYERVEAELEQVKAEAEKSLQRCREDVRSARLRATNNGQDRDNIRRDLKHLRASSVPRERHEELLEPLYGTLKALTFVVPAPTSTGKEIVEAVTRSAQQGLDEYERRLAASPVAHQQEGES